MAGRLRQAPPASILPGLQQATVLRVDATALAQWLEPPEQMMAKAMEVAEHIASLPPLATRVTKESLRSGFDSPLGEAVLGDLYRFAALEMTEDKAESHESWRERRKPSFKGR